MFRRIFRPVYFATVTIILFIIASVLGLQRESIRVINNLEDLLPSGSELIKHDEGLYLVTDSAGTGHNSFLILEQYRGYGGNIETAIRYDSNLLLTGINILRHRETPSFLRKVERKGYIKTLEGRPYTELIDPDFDIVSGATYTSEAISYCVRNSSRHLAHEFKGYSYPEDDIRMIKFGIREISLVLLYLAALVSIYTRFRYRKLVRWITMTGGLIILGFWLAIPLTLFKVNTFLLGYWPDWHNELYWYLLVSGFVLSILISRKNIYCNWICPVGCIQDCMGAIGGARPRFSRKVNTWLRYFSRTLAWSAIILALYTRNPASLNYEIFGVALNLTGQSYLFIIAGVFLIGSLFIKRPWCRYLCPIGPLEDFLRILRPTSKKLKTAGSSNHKP